MFAAINGINLYYEDYGRGTPVVFIHGLGENCRSWRHQLAYFRESYRVIAMDLRGHGQSSYNDQHLTMQLFAHDILALLNFLKIEQAHFVGHSMGGLICQEIAANHPTRMLSMTLSDSAGYYPPPLGTEGLESRLNNIDTLSMSEMAEIIAKSACRPDAPLEIVDEVRSMFAANRKTPYRQATIATLKSDYRSHHFKMQQPTLIMVGEFDQTTPLPYAIFLKSVLQSSKLSVIPDAAHMTKLENPQKYNEILSIFLKEITQAKNM